MHVRRRLLRNRSALKSSSKWDGNLRRSLKRRFETDSTFSPYYASANLWDRRTNKKVTRKIAVYPPHEILEWFLERHPDLDPYSDGSRLLLVTRLSDWKKRCGIPGEQPVISLGVCFDSANYNTRDSLKIISINMLSSSDHQRFLFGSVPKSLLCACGCHGKCTLDSFMNILKWSADHLLLGKWPSCRHDGSPFLPSDNRRQSRAGCGMHQGAFIQRRGDSVWLENLIGLGDSSRRQECWLCEHRPEDSNLDGLTSGSHAEGIPNRLSELLSLPGFVWDYIDLDVMHVVDCGILQYFLGSIAMELLLSFGGKRGEDNWKHSLTQLLMLIKGSAKAVGLSVSPVNHLTINMLGGGLTTSVARLKTKAAETRGIAKCFGYILEFDFPPKSSHDRIRKECLHAILEFYKCLGKTWDESVCKTAGSALLSLSLFFLLMQFSRQKLRSFLFLKPSATLHCFGRSSC